MDALNTSPLAASQDKILDALERFLDYRSDFRTFFRDAFYSALVDMVYEREFARLPDEPDIDDFLKTGAECYKINYRLNCRLNEYNHSFDKNLNWYVMCRIWERFPDNPAICQCLDIDKFPSQEDEAEEKKKAFAQLLRKSIKKSMRKENPDSERLTDSVEVFLKKNFDMSILEISRISGTELIIKTEQAAPPAPSVENFGMYLQALKDSKNVSVLALERASGTPRQHINSRLENRKIPTKNFLFKMAFGLGLTDRECEELFKAAKIDLMHKTHSNDLNEKRRDELLISLLRRGRESIEKELSSGSASNICKAVNEILTQNGFETLSGEQPEKKKKSDKKKPSEARR
jgi:transcriptional regulator with XRE-family HTH domain